MLHSVDPTHLLYGLALGGCLIGLFAWALKGLFGLPAKYAAPLGLVLAGVFAAMLQSARPLPHTPPPPPQASPSSTEKAPGYGAAVRIEESPGGKNFSGRFSRVQTPLGKPVTLEFAAQGFDSDKRRRCPFAVLDEKRKPAPKDAFTLGSAVDEFSVKDGEIGVCSFTLVFHKSGFYTLEAGLASLEPDGKTAPLGPLLKYVVEAGEVRADQKAPQAPDFGRDAFFSPAKDAPGAAQSPEAAALVFVHVGKKPGQSASLVKALEDALPALDVKAKGPWPAPVEESLLFVRDGDGKELADALVKAGLKNLKVIPAGGPRASERIKKLFADNPALVAVVVGP